jgi:hypothetical protein
MAASGGGAGKVAGPLLLGSAVLALVALIWGNSRRDNTQLDDRGAGARVPRERTYRLCVSRHVDGYPKRKWEYRLRATVIDVEHFRAIILAKAEIPPDKFSAFVAFHALWRTEMEDGRRVATFRWERATYFCDQSRWCFTNAKGSYVLVDLE